MVSGSESVLATREKDSCQPKGIQKNLSKSVNRITVVVSSRWPIQSLLGNCKYPPTILDLMPAGVEVQFSLRRCSAQHQIQDC